MIFLTLGQIVLQRTAVDERRDDKKVIPLLAKLVDRHDMRMAQARRGLGLAQKALDALSRIAAIELGNLDGDRPVELKIVGLIHVAKGPFAQPAAYLETADLLQRGWSSA